MRLSKKRVLTYSFLFVRPDGDQLTQIGKLIENAHIKPALFPANWTPVFRS